MKLWKIDLNRTMFYLICRSDWFFIRSLWIVQRKRSCKFCYKKNDFDVHLFDFLIVDNDYDVHRFVIHWFYHRDERLCII
jgi:hypothetical protein